MKRTYSRLFKFILNTVTAASILTLIACVFALEANMGSWTPVILAMLAFVSLALTEWAKEKER